MSKVILAAIFVLITTLISVAINWLLFHQNGIILYSAEERAIVAAREAMNFAFIFLSVIAIVSSIYTYTSKQPKVPRPVFVVSGALLGVIAWFVAAIFLYKFFTFEVPGIILYSNIILASSFLMLFIWIACLFDYVTDTTSKSELANKIILIIVLVMPLLPSLSNLGPFKKSAELGYNKLTSQKIDRIMQVHRNYHSAIESIKKSEIIADNLGPVINFSLIADGEDDIVFSSPGNKLRKLTVAVSSERGQGVAIFSYRDDELDPLAGQKWIFSGKEYKLD